MAQRIAEFDLWQPGYGGAQVDIYVAGTTTPASVFEDEALTVSAANPQTLETKTVDGIDYGKFLVPLYTASAYELYINSIDETGIQRPPITTLDGEDASDAEVTPSGGSAANTLADLLGRSVWLEDFGAITGSTVTNTTILEAAVAAVASDGGGTVHFPAGNIDVTHFSIPLGVVLEGAGRDVTFLRSQYAGDVATVTGDKAGFRRLTLDGISLQTGSVGVRSIANDETVFDDVLVKRFETGGHFKGGRYANWRELYVDNCVDGFKCHGDTNSSDPLNPGDQFRNNKWDGGLITTCTGVGLELSYEDAVVAHNDIHVGFESNTGTGLKINGARFTDLRGCWWASNTTNWAIQDDSLSTVTDNTVIGVRFTGGEVDGGDATFADTCQDVVLQGMGLSDCTMSLSLVDNPIIVEDCTEDSAVAISGVNGSKWMRRFRMYNNDPASSGVTTDATVTTAWEMALQPGTVVQLQAKVIARQRNGTGYACYHIGRFARIPGADLAYDTQTANFTVGDVLTGATSGATARIIADSDSGATGTLTLMDIVGTFQDNETITSAGGGSALVNGAISSPAAALLGTTTSLQTAVESAAAWAADFAVTTNNVQVQVTGEAAKTIEWTVSVEVVTSN